MAKILDNANTMALGSTALDGGKADAWADALKTEQARTNADNSSATANATPSTSGGGFGHLTPVGASTRMATNAGFTLDGPDGGGGGGGASSGSSGSYAPSGTGWGVDGGDGSGQWWGSGSSGGNSGGAGGGINDGEEPVATCYPMVPNAPPEEEEELAPLICPKDEAPSCSVNNEQCTPCKDGGGCIVYVDTECWLPEDYRVPIHIRPWKCTVDWA